MRREDGGTHARADDGGLLGGDFGERVAEIFLMVERDRSDGDEGGAGGGRRVEPPAETGFEDGQLDPRRAEGRERDGRQLLEEGRECARLSLNLFGSRAHLSRRAREVFMRNLFAADADALGDGDEVRRGVEPHAQARRARD